MNISQLFQDGGCIRGLFLRSQAHAEIPAIVKP